MIGFEPVFLSENSPDDEKIGQLIYWGKSFHRLGLVPRAAGSLSFRTDRGFVITGGGINLGAIEKEDLVEVSKVEMGEDRILLYAKGRVAPSRESLLHSVIYGFRAEINAVIHTHARLVLTLADELEVPITEKVQPRGSYELAREAEKLLTLSSGVKYFGLRKHGVIALGETLEEAGRLVERMHRIAQDKRKEKLSDDNR